ncbi:hypothetical protein FPZ24_15285 [Sphingomonas panacisoli]|uniref:Uncharacterized protein n=1 Tax=Sphingomonas panacisoli TaxID=1813879 RepID=A0A5B8LKI6_9SPHN|nr:hypothetical protein [Sphingomonas panacisoli]QDZ08661.1 hypothetical protein FPZ24_15285 [Sphingomonas panacisoli]
MMAALVAILTALIAGLLYINPDISVNVAICCLIAASCLAIVAPFEALEPAARKRICVGCIAFVVAIVIAFALAIQTTDDRGPLGALASLATGGIVLAAWSFTIRNRRGRPQWRNYFDR